MNSFTLPDIKATDLRDLGHVVDKMRSIEGIDAVALPREEWDRLRSRLAGRLAGLAVSRAYERNGWFRWRGVDFIVVDQMKPDERIDGEELTDTSNWFREDWDPDWIDGFVLIINPY